ncbi:MAG: hypothetical protein IJQ99_07245 [Synergistaceae bacterium]|nr:hypothetical protein [Synergistaceae bacterium]
MKKIILTIMFVILMCSCSYGATSDDIYVRKDVFEVEMKNINYTLEKILTKLDAQEKSINSLASAVAVLSERVDVNFATLSGRIDGLEKRMDTTNTFLYYLLVLIGAMMILPFFNKWWESREAKKHAAAQTFTLEDVKRLIAEAKLGEMTQI